MSTRKQGRYGKGYFSKADIAELKSIANKEAQKVVKVAGELKFFEAAFAPALDYNGSIVNLSNIGQGDTGQTRDGVMIQPTSAQVSMSLNGETFSGQLRAIIFRWKPNTVPAATAVISGSYVGTPYVVNAPHNHALRKDYQVLSDKTYTVSNNGGSELRHIRESMKLAKQKIQFTVGANTGYNHIYLVIYTDRAAVSSPGIIGVHRLYFTDS